jgi:small subunit ribosomal protein S8
MSMNDTLSDMVTRIRNAIMRQKPTVMVLFSKMNVGVLRVLQEEGYISDFQVVEGERHIQVMLKYVDGQPSITKINRVSKPSLRVYRSLAKLGKVFNGLGIYILSTTQGVLSDIKARGKDVNQGGEVLLEVV